VLGLHSRRSGTLLTKRRLLCGGRTGVDTTSPTVVANVARGPVDYRFRVDVVNSCDIDIVYRPVVVEGSIIPVATLIAIATVAEAVVDAAVETYLRSPVAIVEHVRAVIPAPVAGGPEQARFGSFHPGAWHPVIAFVAVGPIARRPDVALSRRHRLRVDGERWGSDIDGNADLRESRSRQSRQE
jgi:hypothetical protein